jgi:BRCT domain type II-containing protein
MLLRKVGGMVDAKLAAIQDRLLPERSWRPPLAMNQDAAAVCRDPVAVRSAVPRSAVRGSKGVGKKGESSQNGGTSTTASTSAPGPPSAATSTMGDAWTTVLGRKAQRKQAKGKAETGTAAATASAKSGGVGATASRFNAAGQKAVIKGGGG